MQNDSLGLPKGSVRAIIAVMLTGTICYGAIVGDIAVQEFMPIVLMAISFYFVTKMKDGK